MAKAGRRAREGSLGCPNRGKKKRNGKVESLPVLGYNVRTIVLICQGAFSGKIRNNDLYLF
jgi:hypothetical protein